MFTDKRKKRIILVSHCILNQNSISDGDADCPSQFEPIVETIMRNQIGILQLPCPELMCLGLDRKDINGATRELLIENSRIRSLLEEDHNRKKLHILAENIIFQLKEYMKYGFDIIGMIGINRSPSCGIETTSKYNKEINGNGVFIETLLSDLKANGLKIESTGVKTSKIEESIQKVSSLIEKVITE